MGILSVIIPVYNEKNTIKEIIEKVKNVTLIEEFEKEIVVVDDGSTDGSRGILLSLSNIKLIFHEDNQGKGAAVRTGLKECSGNYIIVQDADLEYDPHDFNFLLSKIIKENLLVVYGSRELRKQEKRFSGVSFYLGGIFLTWLTNILYKQKITDEPTCYKMFKTEYLKSLSLKCKKFDFCPEVTALIAKQGIKIEEVPISYYPRHKNQGKKINWKDGVMAIVTLLKYKFK